jgi:hypothetical protein
MGMNLHLPQRFFLTRNAQRISACLCVALVAASALAALRRTSAGDPDVWERRDYSVVIATITDVQKKGEGYVPYTASLAPIATIAGRLDPSLRSSVAVSFYVSSLTSSIPAPPQEGALVLAAVERVSDPDREKPASFWVDSNVCPFMPDDAGIVTLKDLNDPRIAQTLQRIRDARAGAMPKALREAIERGASTRPTK